MKLIFSCIFMFIITFAIAQEAQDLDAVSVTASRELQKSSKTGRNITIISAREIALLPANSIDDLLKYVSGVEVQQRGPAGAQADIVIRGGTFQQVLVLLDGIKINDPITGHFSAYIPIPMSQIERIEILKGPAAALYGSEAVGGVVNIISKTFARYVTEKSDKFNVGVGGGEFGYFSADASYRHTAEEINYSIAASNIQSKGQQLRGGNRSYFYNSVIAADFAIPLAKNWNLMLQASYNNRDFAAQNFYTTFKSDTATEEVTTWRTHAKLKKDTEKGFDEIDIAYKSTADNYLFNQKSIANENNSGLLIAQYIHGINASKNVKLSTGAAFENKMITSNDRGDHNNKNIALFGNVIYSKKALTLSPSARIVYDENYGFAVLPQANLAYRMGNFVWKANVGRAIRSADFTERFNNYNKTLVTGGSIGNPDLIAEKSWSYESGMEYLLADFKASATYFFRDQKDVIDYVPTPFTQLPRQQNLSPTGSFALAKNLNKVQTRGLELEFSYRKTLENKSSIFLNLSGTFLKSDADKSNPSFYIISHARTLFQQKLIYTIKSFSIGFKGIYKERTPLAAAAIDAEISENYWLLNTKIGYNYKCAKAYVNFDNISNILYSDLLGSIMPRRWVTAGLELHF